MVERTEWPPTRDELIHTFGELAIRVRASGYARAETKLAIDLCYAKRDIQLAMLQYEPGPPQPITFRSRTNGSADHVIEDLTGKRTGRGGMERDMAADEVARINDSAV